MHTFVITACPKYGEPETLIVDAASEHEAIEAARKHFGTLIRLQGPNGGKPVIAYSAYELYQEAE